MERKSTTSACGKITMVPEEWANDKYFQWTKPVVSDMATARDLEVESLNTANTTDDTMSSNESMTTNEGWGKCPSKRERAAARSKSSRSKHTVEEDTKEMPGRTTFTASKKCSKKKK
jgi:hypothetical protein